MTEERWEQITGTPEVIQEYVNRIGVTNITINEVYCFEEEFVGESKGFLILLPHPITNEHFYVDNYKPTSRPIFTKQIIENICGLVALNHVLLNTNIVSFIQDGLYDQFRKKVQQTTTVDETGPLYQLFKTIHADMATRDTNDLDKEREEGDENYHFIALIPHEKWIFCEDGRRGNFAIMERKESLSFTKQCLDFLQQEVLTLEKFSIMSVN